MFTKLSRNFTLLYWIWRVTCLDIVIGKLGCRAKCNDNGVMQWRNVALVGQKCVYISDVALKLFVDCPTRATFSFLVGL